MTLGGRPTFAAHLALLRDECTTLHCHVQRGEYVTLRDPFNCVISDKLVGGGRWEGEYASCTGVSAGSGAQ